MTSIFKNKCVFDFIKEIMECNDIQEILNKCINIAEMGYVYERLWDIIIKFGYCVKFPKSQFVSKIGNANQPPLKKLETYNNYLKEKVMSGNTGGASDITLYDKQNNKYIFISSKYKTETQNDSVDKYDVQKIIAVATDSENIFYYPSYDIYLIVRDKQFVLQLAENAHSTNNHITKYFTNNNIMDQMDLEQYFQQFKKEFLKYKPSLISDFDNFFLTEKISLVPRFHQELITENTLYFALQHGASRYRIKNFLWGCKCRSGKTYMVGILIDKFFQFYKKNNINNGKLNVLIITPVPTETMPQFTEELFYKFKEFNDFNIWEAKHLINISSISSPNNIFILSKQYLDNHINENTILPIRNLHLNLIFFDENHYGGVTLYSQQIVESYIVPQTIKVFLTATYKKPLDVWEILENGQMFWSMEDEQICKNIYNNNNNINYLKERHQKVQAIIDKLHGMQYSTKQIFECYLNMPDMYLLTTLFDPDQFDEIKEKIADSKYGFSFESLFAITNKEFQYDGEVRKILRYISGSNKEEDFKKGDRSIFSRISYIQKKKDSRFPFTQIWFLPPMKIQLISTCLKKIMEEDLIFKEYSILCIYSDNKELGDIKKSIDKCIQEAHHNYKRGVILLAGNMLSLGITIESCDVVMLLNNSLSSDKVMQQMFRCMTEGKSGDKKMGFVVDLNISRVLNTCINYSARKNNNNNVEDSIKYIVDHHLINIDVDYLESRSIDSSSLINKLLEIWKNDPINNFKTLLKNLDNDCVEFSRELQNEINNHFLSTNSQKNINAKIKMNMEQTIQSGTDSSNNNNNNSNNNKRRKIDKEIDISFTKDILPYVVPLSCILTIKEKHDNFVEMLNFIHFHPELLGIFDEMCMVWFKHNELIGFIKKIVSEFFDSNSNLHGVIIQFSSSLRSLLDDKKKLLELIHDCLKIKTTEKKQFGEVFTPMKFINNDMLKKLEEYYTSQYHSNIWENMNLKFFDPAAGMGNFPIAIYYKLMTGLQLLIPNESHRQKHIIENMLYMSELNVKNCFVIKQIFNINNNYHLNLYQGDSLELNIEEEFQVNKFDVIIGNPPYNDSFSDTGAGASALYHKFINYYVEKCHFLMFIIPSRWFSGGKGLDKFRKDMLRRIDIPFIEHSPDACSIFGSGVEIKGGVNFFLIDHLYSGSCSFNDVLIELNRYDVLIDNPQFYSIIDKIIKYNNDNNKKLTSLYKGRCYGIEPNDEEKGKIKQLLINNTKNNLDYLKCHVSQPKQKNLKSPQYDFYFPKKDLNGKEYNYWKLITVEAAYKHRSGFGNTFIGRPNEIHTGSYISFKVNTEEEAKSLLSYLKCKLPNFLLSIRKNSQHINEDVCSWIPLPPLNQIWNDEDLYNFFKLSRKEILLLENVQIINKN